MQESYRIACKIVGWPTGVGWRLSFLNSRHYQASELVWRENANSSECFMTHDFFARTLTFSFFLTLWFFVFLFLTIIDLQHYASPRCIQKMITQDYNFLTGAGPTITEAICVLGTQPSGHELCCHHWRESELPSSPFVSRALSLPLCLFAWLTEPRSCAFSRATRETGQASICFFSLMFFA